MTLLDRQEEFTGYLVSGFTKLGLRGWDLAGACAVTGNGTQENLCRSVTTGPKDHGSDGIMQWRLGRLTDMQSWCVKNFGRWDTLEAQAAFTLYETARDYPALDAELRMSMEGVGEGLPEDQKQKAIRRALDYKTQLFCFEFERPNRALAGLANRQKHAASVYMIMGGLEPPVTIPGRKAPPVITDTGIVIAGGAATGGVVIAAQNGATDPWAIALGGTATVVASVVAYLMQPKKAPAMARPVVLTPFERLQAAAEWRALAEAEWNEAAGAFRDSVQDANELIAAVEKPRVSIEHQPAELPPQPKELKNEPATPIDH